jgi:hypothetical protein
MPRSESRSLAPDSEGDHTDEDNQRCRVLQRSNLLLAPASVRTEGAPVKTDISPGHGGEEEDGTCTSDELDDPVADHTVTVLTKARRSLGPVSQS